MTTETDPDTYADVTGMWHYTGSSALTLPADGDQYRAGSVVSYGREFVVTVAMLENSKDRTGASTLLDCLRDEDRQLARWSEVRIRRGGWPPDVQRSLPGSIERLTELSDARHAAMSIRDPDERAGELRRLRLRFGADWFANSRSKTIANWDGPSGRGEHPLHRDD